MSLRTKLLLAFTLLLVVALGANYLLVASQGRRLMNEQALGRMEALTAVMVTAGQYGLGVERNIEELLGDQMIAQAALAAHLVDVAENRAHMSPEEINERLRDIADSTVLDEFWITDEKGHAYLRNVEEIDFTFPSVPTERNQAWEFWRLLDQEGGQFVQKAMAREYDLKVFKYAGVSGIDKKRIVQVGFNTDSLSKFKAGMTMEDLARAAVGRGGILRLQVGGAGGQLHMDTDLPGPAVEGERIQDEESLSMAKEALTENAPVTRRRGDYLIVASPFQYESGIRALLLTFDAGPVAATVRQALGFGALVTGGLLVLGIYFAFQFSRRIAEPVQTLAAEAAEIGQGNLDRRVDVKAGGELEVLSNAFNQMVTSLKAHTEELRRATAAKQSLETEMRVAANVQSTMLPRDLPKVQGLPVFASTEPARIVGGDFYDFVEIPDGRLAFAIGDAWDTGSPRHSSPRSP